MKIIRLTSFQLGENMIRVEFCKKGDMFYVVTRINGFRMDSRESAAYEAAFSIYKFLSDFGKDFMCTIPDIKES